MIFNPTRYAIVYALTALGLTFAVALMILLAGINLSSAAVQFLPVLAAAMLAGQHHARSGAEKPTSGQMWNAAGSMTAISGALLLVWTGIQLALSGAQAAVASGPLLLMLAIIILIYLLANRFFYQIGFNAEMRDRNDS